MLCRLLVDYSIYIYIVYTCLLRGKKMMIQEQVQSSVQRDISIYVSRIYTIVTK